MSAHVDRCLHLQRQFQLNISLPISTTFRHNAKNIDQHAYPPLFSSAMVTCIGLYRVSPANPCLLLPVEPVEE